MHLFASDFMRCCAKPARRISSSPFHQPSDNTLALPPSGSLLSEALFASKLASAPPHCSSTIIHTHRIDVLKNRGLAGHEAGHTIEALLWVTWKKLTTAHMRESGEKLASVASKEFLSLNKLERVLH